MEPSKAQGKRSFKYKMEEEAEEEEEEEEDDDVSGPLGFSSAAGGDEYMIRKKRPTTMTSNSSTASISRPGRGGSGSSAGGSTVRPLCQADSCNVDLSEAKHYHRRHKICEVHAKAPVVLVGGFQQRFCQQCSRFHGLQEFDDTKRSCRRRLAGHNERRRKSSSDIHREGLN